ncbi:MAG: GFA family protein [Alphaproteobacteria bacterium]
MAEASGSIGGGCFCGAVRYRFPRPPVTVRACWCRDCQYLASGNASVNAIFRSEGFAVSGPLVDFVSVADSGAVMHRRFCATCGTHLFSEAESRPHLVVVRAGTLDDPFMARPQSVIWAGSAPAWAVLDPTLPTCPGQPPPIPAS